MHQKENKLDFQVENHGYIGSTALISNFRSNLEISRMPRAQKYLEAGVPNFLHQFTHWSPLSLLYTAIGVVGKGDGCLASSLADDPDHSPKGVPPACVTVL